MSDSAKKILKREYEKLKKVFEKLTTPAKNQPQLILQPIPIKRN